MRKNYTFLLLLFLGFSLVSFAQSTSARIDSILVNKSYSVCESIDTVTVFFTNGTSAQAGLTLELKLPNGYYLDNSYRSFTLPNTPTPRANNEYWFSGIAVLPNQKVSFRFLVGAGCDAEVDRLCVNILGNSNTPIIPEFCSKYITIEKNVYSFEGLENTNIANSTTLLNNMPIDLINLSAGDRYIRRFRVKLNSHIKAVDQVQIVVENKYHNIIGVSNQGVVSNYATDTVLYTFDTTSMNGWLQPDSTFVFTDTVEVNMVNCGIPELDITSDIFVNVSCNNEFCNQGATNIVTAIGRVYDGRTNANITASTSIYGHIDAATGLEVTGGYSPCNNTETDFFEITFTNNNTDTLFNLEYFLGSFTSNSYYVNNFFIDSFLVNNQVIPTMRTNDPRYSNQHVHDFVLTPSNYSGGGLVDGDNDGIIDDLPPNGMITFKMYFHTNDQNPWNNIFRTDDGLFYSWWTNIGGHLYYDNFCRSAQTPIRSYHRGRFMRMNRRLSDFVVPPLINGNTPFNVTFNENSQFTHMAVNKFVYTKRVIVPKGILFSSLIWTGGGLTSANATVTTLPGTTHDTIVVVQNRIPNGNTNENFRITFQPDCSQKVGVCQRYDFYAQSIIQAFDGNGNLCNEFLKNEQIQSSILWEGCPASMVGNPIFGLVNGRLRRATFGWTDTSMNVRVDENTSGVALERAHNFDSLLVEFDVYTLDTISRGLFFDFYFNHPYNTINLGNGNYQEPLSIITNAGYIEFFDVSSNQRRRFNFNSVQPYAFDRDTVTGEVNMRFDLSNYIDSMRTATGNPNFIPGGDLNSTIYSRDSIKIRLYFYSNDEKNEFSFIPEGGLRDSNMNANPANSRCVNVKLTNAPFEIVRYSVNDYFTVWGNRNFCNTFYLQIGHNPIGTSTTANHFPNEFKPTGTVDSLTLRWTLDEIAMDPSLDILFDSIRHFARPTNTSSKPSPLQYYSILPSGDGITFYPSRIPYQFGNGAKGAYGFGIPIKYTCMAINSLGTQQGAIVEYYMEGKDYILGVNGPHNANYIYTNVNTNNVYRPNWRATPPPPQNLYQLNTLPTFNVDTASWEIVLSNSNQSASAELLYNWIAVESNSGGVNVLKVTDITNPANPVVLTPNTYSTSAPLAHWYKAADTLNYQKDSIKIFRIEAILNACGVDSLVVKSGFNCAGWPDSATFTYPTSAYSCSNTEQKVILNSSTKVSSLELTATTDLPVEIELCDTITYTLRVRNVEEGVARNIFIKSLSQNQSNLNIVPNSSTISWPLGSAPQPIADPSGSFAIFRWDLSNDLNNGFLPGNLTTNDSNVFEISFKLTSACPFNNGDQMLFGADYTHFCGSQDSILSVASDVINIKGIPVRTRKTISVDAVVQDAFICSDENVVRFNAKHIFGDTTQNNTFLSIEIDSNFNVAQIDSGHNLQALSSLIPINNYISTTDPSKRIIDWSVAPGFALGDSISFYVNLTTDNYANFTCSDSSYIKIVSKEMYDAVCISNNSICVITLISDSITYRFATQKANLDLVSALGVFDGCSVDPRIILELDVNTTLSDIANQKAFVRLLEDYNYNNAFDNSDLLLRQDTMGYLNQDSTQRLMYSFSIQSLANGRDNNLIIHIDSSTSCVCSSDTLIIPLTYDNSCDCTIPQFISPNNDGLNDKWIIECLDYFPKNKVRLYNRYGTLVYQKENYDQSFDGTSNMGTKILDSDDKFLPSGTYYYIIEIDDETFPNPFVGYIQIQK